MSLIAPNRKAGRKLLKQIAEDTGLFDSTFDHMPPELDGTSPLFAVESYGNAGTSQENTAVNRYRCVIFVRRIDFGEAEDALDDIAYALRKALLEKSSGTDAWHFTQIDDEPSLTGSTVTDETHGVQYRTEDIFVDAIQICG